MNVLTGAPDQWRLAATGTALRVFGDSVRSEISTVEQTSESLMNSKWDEVRKSFLHNYLQAAQSWRNAIEERIWQPVPVHCGVPCWRWSSKHSRNRWPSAGSGRSVAPALPQSFASPRVNFVDIFDAQVVQTRELTSPACAAPTSPRLGIVVSHCQLPSKTYISTPIEMSLVISARVQGTIVSADWEIRRHGKYGTWDTYAKQQLDHDSTMAGAVFGEAKRGQPL